MNEGTLVEGKIREVEPVGPGLEAPLMEYSTPPAGSRYVLMPLMNTYAQGVEALQKELRASPTAHPTFVRPDENFIYRPLTFRETIQARVENYETLHHKDGRERTLEERLFLIITLNDTCTALAYQAGTTMFKIIPQSSDLVLLAPNFKEESLALDFDSLHGTILDSNTGKYGAELRKTEVLEHPAWRAAVEEELPLLTTYVDIIFTQLGVKSDLVVGMTFWTRQSTGADQLRALYLNSLYNLSGAYDSYLNKSSSFLRVAHPLERNL